jgi:hypothetical protein
MGKRLFSTLLLLTLTACTHATPTTRTPAGTAISGGGNGDVAEFFRLAKLFHYSVVKARMKLDQPVIDHDRFNAVMAALVIEGTSIPLFTQEVGAEVEALNYPSLGKIQFQRQAWERKAKLDKYRLVVHEMLGLLQIPDPQYSVSEGICVRSRQILSYDGVSFDTPGGDQMLYTDASGDPVICRVNPPDNWDNVLVEFQLHAGGGVAAEKAQIDADTYVEVAISYDAEQQVWVTFTHGSGRGKAFASSVMDYYGKFRTLELVANQSYEITCRLSSVK